MQGFYKKYIINKDSFFYLKTEFDGFYLYFSINDSKYFKSYSDTLIEFIEKITEHSTGLRRINFEGSKNTVTTALSSLDVNGKKDYTPVTYILTNPYALVGDARESVQLRTEFDTGNEND